MSWKSLVTAGLLCVLASPAFAAPTCRFRRRWYSIGYQWISGCQWQLGVERAGHARLTDRPVPRQASPWTSSSVFKNRPSGQVRRLGRLPTDCDQQQRDALGS